jgi:hypothetical protein
MSDPAAFWCNHCHNRGCDICNAPIPFSETIVSLTDLTSNDV